MDDSILCDLSEIFDAYHEEDAHLETYFVKNCQDINFENIHSNEEQFKEDAHQENEFGNNN